MVNQNLTQDQQQDRKLEPKQDGQQHLHQDLQQDNANKVGACKQALLSALGSKKVLTERYQLLAYSYDATNESMLPDVVVVAEEKEDILITIQLANQYALPVVSRGAGTNLSGGTIPIHGGIILNLTKMDKVLSFDPERRSITVQPGIRNMGVNRYLEPYGYFFAPDPSSFRIATIGGNCAENSGGPHCLKYGITTNHVLGAEVILANGEVLRLGGKTADNPEYDLLGVIIGSEGTLGVISEVTLKITPLPQATKTMLVVCEQLEQAVQTVSDIIAAQMTPAALELVDKHMVKVINESVGAGYPEEAEAVLIIEVDGLAADVEQEMEQIIGICRQNKIQTIQVAHTEAERALLWRGRRAAYGALARMSNHVWIQDVTVPRPQLVSMIRAVQKIAEKYKLTICTAAHAGDGNLHPTIPFNHRDPDEQQRMKAADQEIIRVCVELGGSISGEHGIGIDKIENMKYQFQYQDLAWMWQIKQALDPQGLMNPGKCIPALESI